MKIQLLEPDAFPAGALARLSRLGTVIQGAAPDTRDVEAVFTRLGSVLDEAFHAHYPRLRWIVSPTTRPRAWVRLVSAAGTSSPCGTEAIRA